MERGKEIVVVVFGYICIWSVVAACGGQFVGLADDDDMFFFAYWRQRRRIGTLLSTPGPQLVRTYVYMYSIVGQERADFE